MSNRNRRVRYYEMVRAVPGHEPTWKKMVAGEATFVQFGVDYEELESGPGNFSTAIIELDNGEVKNIPAAMIKFIVDTNQDK